MSTQTFVIIIIIGLAAGMLSGLVGVGVELLSFPLSYFFLASVSMEAQGTSLGILLLPAGIFAVINYYKQGFIDIKVVLILFA